jgi:hypothetical protein
MVNHNEFRKKELKKQTVSNIYVTFAEKYGITSSILSYLKRNQLLFYSHL